MSERDQVGLSVLFLVQNAEAQLAEMCRQAEVLAAQYAKYRPENCAQLEILVFDHDSTDNSLAALQLLARRRSNLRIFAHTAPGSAIKRGARCARGMIWLFADSALHLEDAQWALQQVLDGHPAAFVDGELMVLPRGRGIDALSWHDGGLWSAQLQVESQLRRRHLHAARRNAGRRGLRGRIQLAFQGRWSRVQPKLKGQS